MQYLFFLMINFLALVLRIFLAFVFIVLKNVIPFLHKRINFERKNLIDEHSKSFKKVSRLADVAFFVSSEGELEQVRPVIEWGLKKRKNIEIVYTSDSVEKKCKSLALGASENLRIYRLPLLSFFPFNFLYFQSVWSFCTAKTIIFCRYDFLPELLFFKFLNRRMVLVSAVTKKWDWYKKQSVSFFEYIIAANELEQKNLEAIYPNIKIDHFDFRIPRIAERLKLSEETLSKFSELKKFIHFLETDIPKSEGLIIGSAWPSDLKILADQRMIEKVKKNELFILVAPHKLNEEYVNEIGHYLNDIFMHENVFIFNESQSFKKAPIIILTIPGILCEMYKYFNMAYVGGGFHRSIHSVLEPYLAGCKVICGPIIHRSAEFDMIKNLTPHEVKSIKQTNEFYDTLIELKNSVANKQIRYDLIEGHELNKENYFNELLK